MSVCRVAAGARVWGIVYILGMIFVSLKGGI